MKWIAWQLHRFAHLLRLHGVYADAYWDDRGRLIMRTRCASCGLHSNWSHDTGVRR